jgi:hypothetical protein
MCIPVASSFKLGRTYPQMPVLLIPTVTSPIFRSAPFCTLSSDGSASATQRWCSGLVYTPIFALEGWTMVDWVSVAEGDMAALSLGL